MFEEKTVLILGAGASAEFELPTGASVFKSLLGEAQIFDGFSEKHPNTLFKRSFTEFLYHLPRLDYLTRFPILYERARRSYAGSIDLFSYDNESTIEISKLYSVWRIVSTMYELRVEEGLNALRPTYLWRNPFLGENENWICALCRKFTEGCDNVNDLKKNKLSVVSFNYENIFEDAFRFFITNSERFSEAKLDDILQILNVYGKFNAVFNTANELDLEAMSRNIYYINDVRKKQSDLLPMAAELIADAKTIYVLGFDMHPDNEKLINVSGASAEKYAVNYDGNLRLQSRLQAAGFQSDNILTGNPQTPMSAAKACQQGFFDLADLRKTSTTPNFSRIQ